MSSKYASHDQYVARILASGLKTEDCKAWLKVYVHGNSGPRLYVSKAKAVKWIHLTFELRPHTQLPKNGVVGSIEAEMVTEGLTPDQQLAAFDLILSHLASMPSPAPKERKAKKDSSPDAEEVSSSPASPPPDKAALRLAHIARVKKLAESRNTPVSPKLLAEEADLLLQVGAPAADDATQAPASAAE